MTPRTLPAALFAAFALWAAPAMAGTILLKADMTGFSVIPPNISSGSGTATVTVDTDNRTASYVIIYAGLSGAPTSAHFHGPAMAGINAGIVANIPVGPSPMTGTIKLTEVQMAELMMGRYYINLHSQKYPDCELRGDLSR